MSLAVLAKVLPLHLVAHGAVHSYDVLYLCDFYHLFRDLHLYWDLQLLWDLLCRRAAARQLVHLILYPRDALGNAVGGQSGLWVMVPTLCDGGTKHSYTL